MVNLSKAGIEFEEIVSSLKKEIKLKGVSQKILYRRVIEKAAEERGLTVTVEEVQEEADRIRLERRLERASDTLAWLLDQMISAEDWEEGIHDRLLEKKLSEHLFDKEAEKSFAQNKFDYDRVILYQIILPDERVARELFYQIEEQEISFYQAAHLYDIDPNRRNRCGYEGQVERWSLKPASIAAEVFGSPIGELVGPVQTELGYHLLLVEEFIPAEFTPQRQQQLRNRMFKEWLDSEVNYLLHNQT